MSGPLWQGPGLVSEVLLVTETGQTIVTETGVYLASTASGPALQWPVYLNRSMRTWLSTPTPVSATALWERTDHTVWYQGTTSRHEYTTAVRGRLNWTAKAPGKVRGHGPKVGGWSVSRRLLVRMMADDVSRSVLTRSARENARQFRAALLRARLVEETRVAQAKAYLESTMYSILLAEL